MVKGTVVKSTGSWYYVKGHDDVVVACRIRGKFRIKGIRATNPVVAGDNVIFDILEGEDTGIITAIGERKNYIIRKSSKLSKEYQLLASNIDILWLMVSMVSPRTYTEFIDRILVAAESFRIKTILIFNKIDIYSEAESMQMEQMVAIYAAAGYQCISLSAKTGEGINEVYDLMSHKTNVIAGNSGVGKSTLVNAIDPGLSLKIGEISDYHQSGKHTTTYAEMFELSNGGKIIDTPGIKGFGMIDIEREELFHFFPEIFKESKHCQFHNCLHYQEPRCAVKTAVENGRISQSRYNNYINLLIGDEEKYR